MRVTDAQVRNQIQLKASYDTSDAIDMAEILVNELLANSGLSDDRMDKIALMLACHFATFGNGGQHTRKWIGETREEWAITPGAGLGATIWGQMAVSMDTSGSLADLARTNLKAQFRCLPTNPTRFGNPPQPDPETS